MESPSTMADKARAEECKKKGNDALAAKDYDAAVAHYTEAIALDPTNHVYFSNRSAAYLSMSNAPSALEDAEQCVKLSPAWSKGLGRKGAALHAMYRFQDAIEAYEEGLRIEPGSDALKSGLADAKAALERENARRANPPPPGPGMTNPFGPDMFAKLAGNAKLAPYLADEAFVAKLRKLQASAGSKDGLQGALTSEAMSDPRMLEVIMALLGVATGAGAGDDDDDDMLGRPPAAASSAQARSAPPPAAAAAAAHSTPAAAPTPAPAPSDVDMEDAEAVAKRATKARAASAKEAGNAAYKAKRFEEALAKYREAAELDPDELIYLVNEAAVHMETGKLDECIAVCQRAIERGREIRAPYATIAKAFARIGNAQHKKGDLPAAITAYENSLLESSTEEVNLKLKAVRTEHKKALEAAYVDPVKAAEAKDRGNEAYKAGDFPRAVTEYSEAIKRDPSNAVYHANRSAALTKLADFSGAADDADKAIKLDPKYVRGYCRKAAAQTAMKEYHKALDTYQMALKLEPDNTEAKEGMERVVMKINEGSSAGADPERAARAMADPEIQRIMMDPMVNHALEEIQRDPRKLAVAMKDSVMAAKIQKLIAAGVIAVK